jgi:hypothetical protein
MRWGTKQYQTILRLRGLGYGQAEIGTLFHVTKSRIHQLENTAVRMIRGGKFTMPKVASEFYKDKAKQADERWRLRVIKSNDGVLPDWWWEEYHP